MTKACIYSESNIIYKINHQFIALTGYKQDDLIGKSLAEVDVLLRSQLQRSIQDIKDTDNLYIFGKDNLPVEVLVSCETLTNENHKVYYFEKEEDPVFKYMLHNFDNIYVNPNEAMAILSYPQGILLRHNKKCSQMLSLVNVNAEDTIGKIPGMTENILKVFKRKTSWHEPEVESIDSNGMATYWDISMKITCGKKDTKYFVVSFYDVTEKVQIKKTLEKQQREMKIILDNMSDAINIINRKGEYTYINKRGRDKIYPYIHQDTDVNSEMAYGSFGMSDITGKRLLLEEIPDQRVLRGERLTNEILIGTSHLPTTYYECDGIPVYDEQGNIDGGILIYRDIESIYKAEEYSAFKENIKDISIYYAVLSHEDFKIKYINEYGFNSFKKRMPNINVELDVIGKSFFNFYQSEDKNLIKHIRKAIKNHSSYLDKERFVEEGEVKYGKTLFQATYDENNKVQKIIAIGIDISDEEITNRKMAEVLKNQEEMLINISHELKTPLNVILSASQLLGVHLENDDIELMKDSISSSNKIITRNGYRLNKLINNILDISKIESGVYEFKLANYNLIDVIDDIVESVSEYVDAKDLKILFDTLVEDLILALDIDNFEKVLLNLISNAIKFSNPGGTIMINLMEKDNIIQISVEDQGIGIEEESLEVIFEKFKQLNTSLNRNAEGTGIGLALVKSIVELHDGSIKVESTLGQGSKFTIEFPARTLENENITDQKRYNRSKSELINYELSDIYA